MRSGCLLRCWHPEPVGAAGFCGLGEAGVGHWGAQPHICWGSCLCARQWSQPNTYQGCWPHIFLEILTLHPLVVLALYLPTVLALDPLVVPAQHLPGPSPPPMGGPSPLSPGAPALCPEVVPAQRLLGILAAHPPLKGPSPVLGPHLFPRGGPSPVPTSMSGMFSTSCRAMSLQPPSSASGGISPSEYQSRLAEWA